jgi:hypothetical protein
VQCSRTTKYAETCTPTYLNEQRLTQKLVFSATCDSSTSLPHLYGNRSFKLLQNERRLLSGIGFEYFDGGAHRVNICICIQCRYARTCLWMTPPTGTRMMRNCDQPTYMKFKRTQRHSHCRSQLRHRPFPRPETNTLPPRRHPEVITVYSHDTILPILQLLNLISQTINEAF